MNRIIITEEELHRLIYDAINESMSIADEVANITHRLIRYINSEIRSNNKNTAIYSGSFKTSILGEIYDILWTVFDVTKNADANTGATINFKNKTINVALIVDEGGLDVNLLADGLQHEIEHLYQKKRRPDEEIFNSKDSALYEKVMHLLNASPRNSDSFRIARCVYLMFNAEQDAYVNGLYGALMNGDFNEDNYYRNDAIRQLNFLRDFYNSLIRHKELANGQEFQKTLAFLQKSPEWLLNHADKAIRRFSRKIGRVERKANSILTNRAIDECMKRSEEGIKQQKSREEKKKK